MTIFDPQWTATADKVSDLCRAYVAEHGNDTDHSDYHRLTADVQDSIGRQPDMGYVDEVIGYLATEAQVDLGNILPGLYPVSHPEHGPRVDRWKQFNGDDIRASLVGLLGIDRKVA